MKTLEFNVMGRGGILLLVSLAATFALGRQTANKPPSPPSAIKCPSPEQPIASIAQLDSPAATSVHITGENAQNVPHDNQSSTETACTEECLSRLTKKLMTAQSLDGSELTLTSNNAQAIARSLQQFPAKIIDLETAITATGDSGQREVLLFVLSKLPKERLLDSARRFNYSSEPSDRLAGLSLLESSIGSGVDVSSELSQFIHMETDEIVLVRALALIDELPAKNIDLATQTTLTELIENESSEQLTHAALMAKISVAESDEDVRHPIFRKLQSQSDSMQSLGLIALDKVLARQTYLPEMGAWQQDLELRKHVLAIANDTRASLPLRMEALSVAHRHFK